MALDRSYFVPGRVELFGKHTDYAGGRSLLCAIDRGLRVRVQPRDDTHVCVESDGHGRIETSRYVEAVVRRLGRDFGELRGADISISSDLPEAAGLSSSSALVVAIARALIDVNALPVGPPESLAQYLGVVETGVGTEGDSQDHTAILCARAGEVAQYAFAPVRREASIPFPHEWTLTVAVSGVRAEKTGAARECYNRAAADVELLCTIWREETGREDATLADALKSSPDAAARIGAALAKRVPSELAGRLRARMEQFWEESERLVPAAADAVSRADLQGLSEVAERSQFLAESGLANQVPETVALARKAHQLGAAASAFGAGFGGSVWAIVETHAARAFLEGWASWYRNAHPAAVTAGALFFATRTAEFSTGCTAMHLAAVENEGGSKYRS